MAETCSRASSTRTNFYFWKTLNLDFWWYFKVLSLGRFWQILEILSSFGQIFLHSQWPRECPNLDRNLKNPITFQPWVQMLHATAHWKATIHIYCLKMFQKIQKFIAFVVACPKTQNPFRLTVFFRD
jgi:hypothetical protein